MCRLIEDLITRSFFSHLAAIHNKHAVTHLGDNSEIVGNQDNRGVYLIAQFLQKIQDLCLDRYVQRGRRLIRDDDARLADQRDRDHDTLLHTAGQLMRILFITTLRLINADQTQDLQRPFPDFCPGHPLPSDKNLLDLFSNRHGRV